MSSSERASLLSGDPSLDTPASDFELNDAKKWYEQPRLLLINFLLMTVCFSTNHGTITAVLAVASSFMGDHLAGFSSGTLYIVYTLSALLVAAGFVQKIGAKFSIAIGLLIYCAYPGSFLAVAEVSEGKGQWIAAIVGSAIGGFAAGFIWTAQGAYFARTAQLYAAATGKEPSAVNAWLAGIFSTAYVGLEVICKGLSSLLHRWGGNSFVFGVLTALAVVSAVLMFFVRKLPEEVKPPAATAAVPTQNTGQSELPIWARKVVLAMRLLVSNRKMQLLGPLNAAFGFTAAFMNQYVNGTPLKLAIGADNVGYMAAITPAVAAILSLPYAAFTNKFGKKSMMVFGAINYATMAFTVLALSQEKLVSLGWGLVFLYILGGSGRAVFEGTNKATFADFFPEEKEGAFANVVVLSGGASALAFFIFPYLTKLPMAIITGGTAIFAIFCLVWAFAIYEDEQKLKNSQEMDGSA